VDADRGTELPIDPGRFTDDTRHDGVEWMPHARATE
jgi:hypothetical protein